MRRILWTAFIALRFFISPPGALAQFPCADFEIVESIPVETTLDNPDVRNATEVWLEMIHGAKKTLEIEQFYVSNEPGEPLEEIIQAIEEAAARGVQVRFIAEKNMYRTYPKTLDRLGKAKNIDVRIIAFGALRGGGVQHAKFFIVDAEQVFLGSQNFDWRALKHIHEIGLRIRHARAAQAFRDVFEIDWQLAGAVSGEPAQVTVEEQKYRLPFRVTPEGKTPIEFSPVWAPKDLSPNGEQWALAALLELIQGAQDAIEIELLTYAPISRDKSYWPEIDVALRSAAARGVKVRMIVADWSKTHPRIDHLKSLALVPNVEVHLSTIPPHSSGHIPFGRVTHAKFMTVDGDRCWVGCSNWQKEYYYNSRDVGVVVQSGEVTGRLRAIFQKDWDSEYTYAVQPGVEYKPPQVGP